MGFAADKPATLVGEVVRALVDVIKREVLLNDGKVFLANFGVFEKGFQPARECLNPQTGVKMKTEPRTMVKFRAGKAGKKIGEKR